VRPDQAAGELLPEVEPVPELLPEDDEDDDADPVEPEDDESPDEDAADAAAGLAAPTVLLDDERLSVR
jgi:hypothetical protein